MKTFTWCWTTSFGFQPNFFLVQVGLDLCQCAWPAPLIQVSGTDSVLTLGNGEGALQKEKTQVQPLWGYHWVSKPSLEDSAGQINPVPRAG
jgi:hypothetical protein